jgi:hypothetical protein
MGPACLQRRALQATRTVGGQGELEALDRHGTRFEYPIAMSGNTSDARLDRLRRWGVTRVDGYPGDGINGLLGAFDRAKEASSSSRRATRKWRRSWRARTRRLPAR